MAVTEDAGGAIVITAGNDRAVRSWHLDGQPGPLIVTDAHTGLEQSRAGGIDFPAVIDELELNG